MAKLQQTSWHISKILAVRAIQFPIDLFLRLDAQTILPMEHKGHVFWQEWCGHLMAESPGILFKAPRNEFRTSFQPANK